jgi:hypothetical protein
VDDKKIITVDLLVVVAILKLSFEETVEIRYDSYLLEVLHVSLHGQERAVGVNGAVSVCEGRLRRFVVNSVLPSLNPVPPRDFKQTTHIPSAAPVGIARRHGLAHAAQAFWRHGITYVGGDSPTRI